MGKKGTLQHEGRVVPDPNYPKKAPLQGHGPGNARKYNERMTYQKDGFAADPLAKPSDGRSIDVSGTGVVHADPGKVPKVRISGETNPRELND